MTWRRCANDSGWCRTPESFEDWVVVMDKLCKDTERPSPPAVADALDRALSEMTAAAEPVPFVDEIVRNLLERLHGDSTHIKLKVLNVVTAVTPAAAQ